MMAYYVYYLKFEKVEYTVKGKALSRTQETLICVKVSVDSKIDVIFAQIKLNMW
ncbi:14427_t:CDS:2 [Gigaspora rosea]|nr:14427_t:CDS:2 [Gigaspora rosea]